VARRKDGARLGSGGYHIDIEIGSPETLRQELRKLIVVLNYQQSHVRRFR
jgi:hypothetical protein